MKYAGIFSVVVETGAITYENFYDANNLSPHEAFGGYTELLIHLYTKYDGKIDTTDNSVWVVVELDI